MTSCDTDDRVNMPFSMIASFHPVRSMRTGVDYIIFRLFNDDGDNIKTDLVFISTYQPFCYYALDEENSNAVSLNIETAKANSVVHALSSDTTIGNFRITIYRGWGSNRYYYVTLKYIPDGCEVDFLLFARDGTPHRNHFLRVNPPACYRCYTCGLLGMLYNDI